MIYAQIETETEYGRPAEIILLGDRYECRNFLKSLEEKYKKNRLNISIPFLQKETIRFIKSGSQSEIRHKGDCHENWSIGHFKSILAIEDFIPISETFFYKP